MTGKLLVAVQVLALIYLAVTGPWLAPPSLVWLEIIALYLGAWAVLSFNPRQLRIWPEVAPDAKLVTRGPYRWIRHPMYAAVLLLTLSLVLSRLTSGREVVWLILLADLVGKLRYEETLLVKRFPEYVAYRKRTWRLIPFVF